LAHIKMILRCGFPVGALARLAHFEMTTTAVASEVFLKLARALLRSASCRPLKPEQRALGWPSDFFGAGEVVPAHLGDRCIEARQERVRCRTMVPAAGAEALGPGRGRPTNPIVADAQAHHGTCQERDADSLLGFRVGRTLSTTKQPD